MWCFCVGKWVGETPLLILQKRWLFSFSFCRFMLVLSSFTMRHNVLQICDGGEGNRKSLIKIRSFEGIENYSEVVVAPLAQMCLLCAVLGPHVPQIVSVAPQSSNKHLRLSCWPEMSLVRCPWNISQLCLQSPAQNFYKCLCRYLQNYFISIF